MSEVDWSQPDVSELPSGTVTLVLADVEGSTRLWDTRPEEMTAAVARLDQALSAVVSAHGGIRPVEQGEGDSFVIAFARASDAVAAALDLQQAALAPITLRIGIHTGDVQLRDEGNYIGPTINRAARLRNLAHGGQTVLSGATELMVVDALPPGVTLTDLGTHPLRGLPRPERVLQLCHPDLCNEFPPLRTEISVVAHNLPAQLTSFIGRQSEIAGLRAVLADNRLATLTGAGGVGKTRLAVRVATESAGEFADGVCYVDLAPITHPELVPVTMARALGLPDQPGQSTMNTLARFLRDRRLLVLLDNCEHLLDASAALVVAVLGAAPGLTVLATSREPLNVAGEAIRRVPSLALADEAIELFAERARLAQADFRSTDANHDVVTEICRRLDGMPLAIELAAARVRALSLTEIRDSLHDRFRLLTGGARTSVRRQQTLRASVDWSHTLLTDTERMLFRRLAPFLGGFDLDAAQAVGGADGVARYQVLDQLTLLVDKSLVVAENSGGPTRYRLLETVRQYALEKLGESGEADAVRTRHRDHFTAMAACLDAPARNDYGQRLEQAEVEMDNLRAAFGWSLEISDVQTAMALASSLQPVWYQGGRIREGQAWFDTAFAGGPHSEVATAVRARALADKAVVDYTVDGAASMDQAQQALAMARELDDPALLCRVLTGCGFIAGARYQTEAANAYFAEAIGLARALQDRWSLSQILTWQANTAISAGDQTAARAAAEEGLQLASALGDGPNARGCQLYLAWARLMRGELAGAVTTFGETVTECESAHDTWHRLASLQGLSLALTYRGEMAAARAAAEAAIAIGAELGGYFLASGECALSIVALAVGDHEVARDVGEAAAQHWGVAISQFTAVQRAVTCSEAALVGGGDLIQARRWADEAVSVLVGWQRAMALTTRGRLAIAQGDPGQAERDAHDALACAAEVGSYVAVPDALELLARLAEPGRHPEAVRLLAAAVAMRERIGLVRYPIHQGTYDASLAALRAAMADKDFDAAWAEGAALSTEQAIAYAQRGRGERKRPASGWAALTPAELDVVRLACEGLGNKDIATRLFVSPRTVQAHLTHVYTKLGVSSRMRLAQEAARHH